jgi:H2-forming N5,N10-methylenetetrahydromethanopterin dehydrogenase-like enzyme
MWQAILSFLSNIMNVADKVTDSWKEQEIRKRQELIDALRASLDECKASSKAELKEMKRNFMIERMSLHDRIQELEEKCRKDNIVRHGRKIEG